MTLAEHLASILSDLAASSSVASFDIVEQWVAPDGGYIRVRA